MCVHFDCNESTNPTLFNYRCVEKRVFTDVAVPGRYD